jgi:Zn-dependent membrane protease YugP
MHLVILITLLFLLVIGPGLWVTRVMKRYHLPVDRYAYSGSQTARRLLDSLGLQDVAVEEADIGDHYDPEARAVRLSPANYKERSLTAVTVAAHEVGHALQHASGYAPLMWRTRMVKWVSPIEKTGVVLMMAAPVIFALIRLPMAGLIMGLAGLMTLGSAVVIHLLTLPTEFDASFGRALPLMKEQDVLYSSDEKHARRLLKAAAMTYVSASLMSLLNIARWIAILRR